MTAEKQKARIHSQRRDLFQFIRYPMYFAAMYPLSLEKYFPRNFHFIAFALEFFIEIFLYFSTLHIAILYICMLYLFDQGKDLELLVNILMQLLIYLWTILMKIHFRRLKPKVLKDIMDTLNKGYEMRSAKGFTYVDMDEAIKKSNKWFKIYVTCCFSGTFFWLIIPIAYNERTLPLPCWYPFDYKAPFVYETLYFLQIAGQLQVAAAFSVSSAFQMIMAIILSGQYDLLYCSLKNIVATSYIKMGIPIKKLREVEKEQEIIDEECNQYYCSIEHLDSYSDELKASYNPRISFLQAFKLSFRNCVHRHRYVMGILKKWENFYNAIWLLKSGEVILLMCLVAFVSIKSTTANSSPMVIISLGQYLLLVVVELLVICYFSELISQNSHRCDEALLRSPWFLHSTEIKNDFLIFLMYSQRAFKLTAGKMYKLDINLFRSVMATAFSFFTFLQQMDQIH